MSNAMYRAVPQVEGTAGIASSSLSPPPPSLSLLSLSSLSSPPPPSSLLSLSLSLSSLSLLSLSLLLLLLLVTAIPDTSQDEIIARAYAASYEGQGYNYRDRRPSDCASIPPVVAEPAYDYGTLLLLPILLPLLLLTLLTPLQGTWQSPSLARNRELVVRDDPADFWVFMVCCILW